MCQVCHTLGRVFLAFKAVVSLHVLLLENSKTYLGKPISLSRLIMTNVLHIPLWDETFIQSWV